MYSLSVILTLIGMITAGAGRIVAVKLYYQLELDEDRSVTPMFVTLLYLVGQALSLVVHFLFSHCIQWCDPRSPGISDDGYEAIEMSGGVSVSKIVGVVETDDSSENDSDDEENRRLQTFLEETDPLPRVDQLEIPYRMGKLKRRGSKTGLTNESKDAIAWVHRIPWYLRPMIPGFCNLCNSALRWGCLVFVAASTAEILISGLELVLSAFAAMIIRKRIISKKRWIGVSVVTLGIVLVGFTKAVEKKESKSDERDFLIGNVLIFGQCFFSVLQDLSEEIFMQEANFPATLLLGMEGLFGLVFGIPICLLFFPEEISSTGFHVGYEIGLVLLVLITGILNIRTTEVTSSMTRNVWKQFRIMLVWLLGILVYYMGSGERFGEAWVFPDSLFVLGSFGVILTGVYFYYSD